MMRELWTSCSRFSFVMYAWLHMYSSVKKKANINNIHKDVVGERNVFQEPKALFILLRCNKKKKKVSQFYRFNLNQYWPSRLHSPLCTRTLSLSHLYLALLSFFDVCLLLSYRFSTKWWKKKKKKKKTHFSLPLKSILQLRESDTVKTCVSSKQMHRHVRPTWEGGVVVTHIRSTHLHTISFLQSTESRRRRSRRKKIE